MWSRHGNASSDELGLLGVQADDPDSYVPEVLWYFGHIARLDPSHVKDNLLSSDAQFEAIAISDSLIKLSHRVLRKHCVNAGWISTAFAPGHARIRGFEHHHSIVVRYGIADG